MCYYFQLSVSLPFVQVQYYLMYLIVFSFCVLQQQLVVPSFSCFSLSLSLSLSVSLLLSTSCFMSDQLPSSFPINSSPTLYLPLLSAFRLSLSLSVIQCYHVWSYYLSLFPVELHSSSCASSQTQLLRCFQNQHKPSTHNPTTRQGSIPTQLTFA